MTPTSVWGVHACACPQGTEQLCSCFWPGSVAAFGPKPVTKFGKYVQMYDI